MPLLCLVSWKQTVVLRTWKCLCSTKLICSLRMFLPLAFVFATRPLHGNRNLKPDRLSDGEFLWFAFCLDATRLGSWFHHSSSRQPLLLSYWLRIHCSFPAMALIDRETTTDLLSLVAQSCVSLAKINLAQWCSILYFHHLSLHWYERSPTCAQKTFCWAT